MNEQILNSLLMAGNRGYSNQPSFEDVSPGASAIMKYGDKHLNYTPGERESENVRIEQPKDESALMAILGALIGKNMQEGFPSAGSGDVSKNLPPTNLNMSMFLKNISPNQKGTIPSKHPKPFYSDTLYGPRPDIDYGAIDKKAGEVWATDPSLDIKSLIPNWIKDKALSP